ncbi:ferredoxin [Nocardia sp. NPDC024068]|uniref:ferredoxin n=1 Tax=Nocardia sp. NPDC024068 TaxID=3157197 RepID=UPI0033C5F38F
MEIGADRGRCIGAGMCVLTAPDVFDQDDADGLVLMSTTTPAPEQEPAVREAAQMCPAGAIILRAGPRPTPPPPTPPAPRKEIR